MSKVGIVKIRQATRPSIVSQNYSAKIDISDLSGVNLGGVKEGDILVYSANTGNFEVRTASISGNNDSALTQYAANHANSAFSYANTISGGSAIDNVARVAATSAGVYANAAFNAANNKVSKSGDIMTGDLKFGGGGGILNLPTDQIAITANVDNDASGFIAQATGVTTVYANTDVIIQANTGGTNLQWNFNKNGTLIFPDSTIQTTAFTGSAIDNVARVAANNKVSKSGDTLTGSLQFFGSDFAIGQYQIGAGNGIDFWANNNTSYAQLNFSNTNFVYVDSTSAALETTNSTVTSHSTGYSEIWASADGNNYYWRFNGNGVLRFPDATLQNTAFTGYAIDNVARNTANSSLSINTGGVVAGAIRATNFVSNSYIEFGDGSRQFTANAGSGGGGGATNLQDYFPTDTNWGFIGNLFSSLGENLIVQYDCKDEPITPRGYLLQKDFGYLT